MPEIRNSHDHGLQIFFIGKQFLVIAITLHVKSVILQPTDIAVAIIIPDIHHGDEADAGNHLQRIQQHLTLRAATDERHIDFVEHGALVGGGFGTGIRAAGGQEQTSTRGGGGADEFPAREGLLYHFLRRASLLCFASISAKATKPT